MDWAKTDPTAFSAYWDAGKAEISSFDLTHLHQQSSQAGNAMLIFLAENFSKSSFVKPLKPEYRPTDVAKVLKLQSRTELETGMSDVRLTSTLHLPIQLEKFGNSLRLTTTQDDWSGQAYWQAAWKGHRYEVSQFSYLESEGDKSYSLVNCHLEEEVWAQIRLSPEFLPGGDVDMVPPASFFRNATLPVKSYKAVGAFTRLDSTTTYVLQYPELKRKLEIEFDTEFPFTIRGWKEWNGATLVCEAALRHIDRTDYWNFQKKENRPMREAWFPTHPVTSTGDSITLYNQ